jgi:dienelactone hydrolase
MTRRAVAAILVATVVAAAAACSTTDRPTPTGQPTPAGLSSASAAQPSPGSVAPSPVAPTRSAGPAQFVAPVGTAPTRDFAVGVRHLKLRRGAARPLPTTVWYPAAGAAGRGPSAGAAPADGRFPVVLFSHGLTSEPSAYADMLTRWTRAGFVVAAPAYPHTAHGVADFDAVDVLNQPADASYVLTQVLKLNAESGDPLRGRLDPERVAAAGHSAGGITTVGLFTSSRDERLTAGVVLAGRQLAPKPFTGRPAALLFVHGKLDRTVGYPDGLRTFQAVPWSRAMLTVTRGGHLTSDRDFEAVVDTSTDFLRWSLYGDPAARSRITGDATQGGVATLTDQLRR